MPAAYSARPARYLPPSGPALATGEARSALHCAGRPARDELRQALPAFGTVKVGMPTQHRLVFVPLNQATVGPGYHKVSYDKKQVKDAPSIGTDGELPAGGEEAIFKHYGLTYQPGADHARLLARR